MRILSQLTVRDIINGSVRYSRVDEPHSDFAEFFPNQFREGKFETTFELVDEQGYFSISTDDYYWGLFKVREREGWSYWLFTRFCPAIERMEWKLEREERLERSDE